MCRDPCIRNRRRFRLPVFPESRGVPTSVPRTCSGVRETKACYGGGPSCPRGPLLIRPACAPTRRVCSPDQCLLYPAAFLVQVCLLGSMPLLALRTRRAHECMRALLHSALP